MSVCRTCADRCLIITFKCLYNGANPLTKELVGEEDKIAAYMEMGQERQIKTLLGDCYTDLCEAIRKSELDVGDPDYAALPTKWVDLASNLTDLVAAATAFYYVSLEGLGNLTKKGVQFVEGFDRESFKDYLGILKANMNEARTVFKDWLEEDAQQTTYSGCLPDCKAADCCDDDPDAEESDFVARWGSTKYISDDRRKNTPARFRGR